MLRTNTGVYVGEWIKGLQQGNGTALYNNGNTYKGEFWEGLKHGKGVFEVPSKGDIYTGQFKNGMRHGKVNQFWYKSIFGLLEPLHKVNLEISIFLETV